MSDNQSLSTGIVVKNVEGNFKELVPLSNPLPVGAALATGLLAGATFLCFFGVIPAPLAIVATVAGIAFASGFLFCAIETILETMFSLTSKERSISKFMNIPDEEFKKLGKNKKAINRSFQKNYLQSTVLTKNSDGTCEYAQSAPSILGQYSMLDASIKGSLAREDSRYTVNQTISKGKHGRGYHVKETTIENPGYAYDNSLDALEAYAHEYSEKLQTP